MILAQKTDTQTSGIEDPEISPHSYKGAKKMCWRKDILFTRSLLETKTRSLSPSLYKNQFKMDQRP
jgi:hypothetical protein